MEHLPAIFPRILGHEAVGVVESVGEGVHEVVEGDTVIPIFLPDCGECTDCLSHKSNLCTKLPFTLSPWMGRDETSRFTDINGQTLYHFLFVSSFSEYTVVDIAHLTKIDPQTPANRACLLSCGVSTSVGAAWKTAKVEAGTTVSIFGLGAIGLAVAEGARLCGAKRIIGIDVNQDKLEIGKKFGVTDFLNSHTCGDKTVRQLCDLYENDSIFDKFECCLSGDGLRVATGSYSNLFRVFGCGPTSTESTTLEASKNPLRRQVQTPSRPPRSLSSSLTRVVRRDVRSKSMHCHLRNNMMKRREAKYLGKWWAKMGLNVFL